MKKSRWILLIIIAAIAAYLLGRYMHNNYVNVIDGSDFVEMNARVVSILENKADKVRVLTFGENAATQLNEKILWDFDWAGHRSISNVGDVEKMALLNETTDYADLLKYILGHNTTVLGPDYPDAVIIVCDDAQINVCKKMAESVRPIKPILIIHAK